MRVCPIERHQNTISIKHSVHFICFKRTLETTRSMRVCPVERHSVAHLVDSKHGVWSAIEGYV